jgi:hypothetical protein
MLDASQVVELKQELRRRGARIPGGSRKADLVLQLLGLLEDELVHGHASPSTMDSDLTATLAAWEADSHTTSARKPTDSWDPSPETVSTVRPLEAAAWLDESSVRQAWTGITEACATSTVSTNEREGSSSENGLKGDQNTSRRAPSVVSSSNSADDPWSSCGSTPDVILARSDPAVRVPSQFHPLGGPDVEKQVCLERSHAAA